MKIGDRVRQKREAIGLSQSELARRAGVSQPVINVLEKGGAESSKKIGAIARALGTTVAELDPQFAETLAQSHLSTIPVVGRVGAGGSISTEWEQLAEPLFQIELPFPVDEDAIGFEISGDSMWPRYDAGDVIVVSKHGEEIEGLLGYEAVVRVGERDGNGDRFFKRIIKGAKPGFYDLESYNASPMRDLKIGWAAGLIARVPATRWKRLNGKAVKAAVKKAKRA